MKKLNYCWSFIAIVALLFTSCSQEESGAVVSDQETYQLQFGTLLNDFEKQSKVHLTDPTVCRDADPSYVLVGVEDSNGIYIGTGGGTTEPSLFRVEIQNNNGSWETSYSEDLALPAGDYSLEYFIVYSADGQVLWVAPREGGVYASSVGNPLPQDITLAPGTKPYINVDVLCFNPRDEEAFGYVFFDINLIEVENNYCIFVNFCYDGTGREYPALFRVDVWADAYGGSDVVVDGEMNSVSGTGNSFAATVLCLPLPPLGEGEVYYARVTVLSAGAYIADGSDVFEFEIDQDNIDDQLDLTPRYRHIRINCGGNPGGGDDCTSNGGDADGDGICDDVDDCINGVGVGCPGGGDDCIDNGGDADEDGICDNEDDCVNGVGPGCNPGGGDCDETAYMQGDLRFSEIEGGPSRWGWIEDFDIATDNGNSYDIYAGASNQYNLNDDTRIGDVTITFNDVTDMVTLTFDFENSLNGFSDLHVNISENIPPRQTLQAPGQYNNNQYGSVSDGDSFSFPWNGDGDFYIVVHGEDSCKDGGSDD